MSKISVVASLGREKLLLRSNVSQSLLDPFIIAFSVTNEGKQIIKYLQFHVWFHRLVNWNFELTDISPWAEEGHELPPAESKLFWHPDVRSHRRVYMRQTLRLSPANDFFLMPSQQPFGLPTLKIHCGSFTGAISMPWKLEVPEMSPIIGALLLGCVDGVLRIEMAYPDTPQEELKEKTDRILSGWGS